MVGRNLLALAVASGRAAYVYFGDGQLCDWGTSVRATADPAEIAGFTQERINELRPDVVVTEKLDAQCRKGAKSRVLIRAITETASHNEVYDIAVPRPRDFPSKFEEAQHLAARYPEIAGYLPAQRRRIYDSEPRGMIVFEALALAEKVLTQTPDVTTRAPR
ncbi:MAG: hypothetical protein AAGE18_05300 [Pseudomonadota bacterium]